MYTIIKYFKFLRPKLACIILTIIENKGIAESWLSSTIDEAAKMHRLLIIICNFKEHIYMGNSQTKLFDKKCNDTEKSQTKLIEILQTT